MDQFLYFFKPARLGMMTEEPTPEEAETVSRHFAYLSDLTDKGVMQATLYSYKVALIRK